MSYRRWAALLVLAASACNPEQDACARLGRLCTDDVVELSLALERPNNAHADLDGDGLLDLVTATSASGLSIAWGRPGQREYRLFPGGVPDAELADVDGDADLDILFITSEPAELHVLANDGARRWSTGQVVALPGRPRSLWVGALDGDASPDAVVASARPGGLTVLTDGLARSRQIIVGQDLVAVEAGDLDRDGQLDIVAADLSGSALFVALARGQDFAAPSRISTGPAPEYLQLTDLDGDGSLDALTHGRAGPEVWLHAGDGAGGLAPPRALLVQDTACEGFAARRDANGGRWLYMADAGRTIATELNDDDRVLRRIIGSQFSTARGVELAGDTLLTHGKQWTYAYSLTPAQIFTELWVGASGSLQPLAIADLDRDGTPDLAVTDYYRVTIHRGHADGQWVEGQTFAVPRYVLSMTAADATGDGLPDLIIGDDAPSVRVAVGAGDGSFVLGPPAPVPGTPWRMSRAFAPSTGAAIVAVGGGPSDATGVTVVRFDAAGVPGEPSRPLLTDSALRLVSADLDADGADDLVALMAEEGELALVIVPGIDTGAPRSRALPGLLTVQDSAEAALALGDIDHDGTLDAVIVARNTIIRLYDIAADTPPAPQVDTVEGIDADDALMAEVNGDDRPDLMLCAFGELVVLLGTAAGPFDVQTALEQSSSNCTLHLDPQQQRPFAATVGGRGVSVLSPALVPALEELQAFTGGPAPLAHLATGDVDADGHADIVVTDDSEDSIAQGGFGVLWGHTSGRPQRATWVASGSASSVIVAPLDDQPGDEILRGVNGRIAAWTYRQGALQLLGHGDTGGDEILQVAVQTRGGAPADVITLGRASPELLRITAVPRAADGAFVPYDQTVTLWEGPDDRAHLPNMTVADLDDDGHADIAVFPGTGQLVHVLWGDPGRTATRTTLTLAPTQIGRLSTGDLDSDGVPELLIATSDGVVSVDLHDRRARTPSSILAAPGTAFHDRLLTADIDSDGVLDILGGYGSQLDLYLRTPAAVDLASIPYNFRDISSVQAVALDDDEILDITGLLGDRVFINLSAAKAP